MPSKSQIFSTVLNEITKGISNLNQNTNDNPNSNLNSSQHYNMNQQLSSQNAYHPDQSSTNAYYSSQMTHSNGPYNSQQYDHYPPGVPPSAPVPLQPAYYPPPAPPQQGYSSTQIGYPAQSTHPTQASGDYTPFGYPHQPNTYQPQQQIPYPDQQSSMPNSILPQPIPPYCNQLPYNQPSQPSHSNPSNIGFTQVYHSTSAYPDLGALQSNSNIQNFHYKPFRADGMPSIRAFTAFNANADAEILRQAMKGIGCDKAKIIAVLCARSNTQRQQIAIAFKTLYGKDLIKNLRSELSGDFEDLILALMETPARYDAIQLHKAMDGIGTKESVLIEIMCSRTNAQIMELKSVYRQMYGNELEKDLIGETSGHFKRLLVSLCAAGRDESMSTDVTRANHDARALYRAGEQRLGTDESCFNAILAAQNYAQLRLVFQEYEKITKHTIKKAIEAEFSGDIKDGLLAIVGCVQNRPAYFAKLLYKSMVGLGTRDNDLIRIIVTRSEIDLVDIRQQFEQLYKKSLESMIKGDCSGAYKDGLIALVRGN